MHNEKICTQYGGLMSPKEKHEEIKRRLDAGENDLDLSIEKWDNLKYTGISDDPYWFYDNCYADTCACCIKCTSITRIGEKKINCEDCPIEKAGQKCGRLSSYWYRLYFHFNMMDGERFEIVRKDFVDFMKELRRKQLENEQ